MNSGLQNCQFSEILVEGQRTRAKRSEKRPRSPTRLATGNLVRQAPGGPEIAATHYCLAERKGEFGERYRLAATMIESSKRIGTGEAEVSVMC